MLRGVSVFMPVSELREAEGLTDAQLFDRAAELNAKAERFRRLAKLRRAAVLEAALAEESPRESA